jgi:divalent metal cation (Fe/Co/Zn/Cd) transporter
VWTRRRGERIEWFAAGWNLFEAVLAIVAGGVAGSAALLSFGLGSLAELATSGVALRELRKGPSPWMHTAVAGLFAAVAAAALLGAGHSLSREADAVVGPTSWTFAVAALSTFMMLIIGLVQRRAGQALGSQVLSAHAKMSFLDGGLAFSVLIGLLLWGLFGFDKADAVGSLLVACIALRESLEVYRDRPTHNSL